MTREKQFPGSHHIEKFHGVPNIKRNTPLGSFKTLMIKTSKYATKENMPIKDA